MSLIETCGTTVSKKVVAELQVKMVQLYKVISEAARKRYGSCKIQQFRKEYKGYFDANDQSNLLSYSQETHEVMKWANDTSTYDILQSRGSLEIELNKYFYVREVVKVDYGTDQLLRYAFICKLKN